MAIRQQILAELAKVRGTLEAIDAKLRTFDFTLVQLVWETKRGFYLDTLQKVQGYEAQAHTAAQQLGEWKQTGKSNSQKLANAENNSQIAANSLKQQSFYMRPGAGPDAPDIFEYRPALLPYLYALTVRLAVVALEQPHFRRFSAYTDEFKDQVAWLKQLPALMETDIFCDSKEKFDGQGNYQIFSFCRDTLSGAELIINGGYPYEFNRYETSWTPGSETDANYAYAFTTFYDRWNIQEEEGEHAVQRFLPLVDYAATPSSSTREIFGIHVELGPLSNGSQCLTQNTLNFLALDACSRYSARQIWTAAVKGETAAISLSMGGCLEESDWGPSSGPFVWVCSTSFGEQWTITADNEIRWAPQPDRCLGTNLRLSSCTGAESQKWYRNWPPLIAPVVPIVPMFPIINRKSPIIAGH